MILDTMENLRLYRGMEGLSRLEAVLSWLEGHPLEELPFGTTEIDGKNIYVMIQEVMEKDRSEALLEVHDVYADLQIVMEGAEAFGYISRGMLGEPDRSRPENDVYFYETEGKELSWAEAKAGMFALFFPTDGHAPGVAAGKERHTKKAVIKIRVT